MSGSRQRAAPPAANQPRRAFRHQPTEGHPSQRPTRNQRPAAARPQPPPLPPRKIAHARQSAAVDLCSAPRRPRQTSPAGPFATNPPKATQANTQQRTKDQRPPDRNPHPLPPRKIAHAARQSAAVDLCRGGARCLLTGSSCAKRLNRGHERQQAACRAAAANHPRKGRSRRNPQKASQAAPDKDRKKAAARPQLPPPPRKSARPPERKRPPEGGLSHRRSTKDDQPSICSSSRPLVSYTYLSTKNTDRNAATV